MDIQCQHATAEQITDAIMAKMGHEPATGHNVLDVLQRAVQTVHKNVLTPIVDAVKNPKARPPGRPSSNQVGWFEQRR